MAIFPTNLDQLVWMLMTAFAHDYETYVVFPVGYISPYICVNFCDIFSRLIYTSMYTLFFVLVWDWNSFNGRLCPMGTTKPLTCSSWGYLPHQYSTPSFCVCVCVWLYLPYPGACIAPYFYTAFLVLLLIDRAFRDDMRCRAKYGKHWDKVRECLHSCSPDRTYKP